MNKGTPSAGKLIGKLVLLGVIVLFAVLGIMVDYYEVRDGVLDGTANADQLRWLDRNYYDGNYAQLYETLTLYELYDESVYGQYWEAVNASQDYEDYLLWTAAAERGFEGATEKAEAFREEILQNAENCRYSFNQTVLDDFEEKVR